MLEQKLYTVADVAELTGLTSRTIRNYLKDGTLRRRKIGVQWHHFRIFKAGNKAAGHVLPCLGYSFW